MTALIIIAAIIVLIILVLNIRLSIKATYDNEKWTTKFKILFFNIKIDIMKILQSVLFKDKVKNEEKDEESEKDKNNDKEKDKNKKVKKSNPIKKIWDEEGIFGIMDFVSNILSSGSKALKILIKGFKIKLLYVKIIMSSPDAYAAAMKHAKICEYYYPLKGLISTNMSVKNFTEDIAPDFIAEKNEYGFDLKASISVGTVVRCALAAGIEFLKGIIHK